MAPPVYTVNVISRHDLVGGTGLLIPPAGTDWILQTIDLSFVGTEGGTFVAFGSADQVFYSNAFAITPERQYASWRGRVVIHDGQSCSFTYSDPGDLTVTAYQLTPP